MLTRQRKNEFWKEELNLLQSLTKSRNVAKLRLQMLSHVTILISHCFLSLIVVFIVS